MTKFLLVFVVSSFFLVAAIPAPSEAAIAAAQVTIQNKTGSQVRITLTGAQTYYFTLGTGKTKVSMETGTYTFSYGACGTTITGRLKVKGNANLTLPKCQTGKTKGEGKEKCDPSYPTVCIPPRPPDLDCNDITFRRFKVKGKDPHNFDGDHDGIGCET